MSNENYDAVPENYKPISMWGYFGYELLFSIPVLGLILLIVFSLGGTSNVNLKNFARSYFCYFIIMAVIIALVIIVMMAFGGLAVFGSLGAGVQ